MGKEFTFYYFIINIEKVYREEGVGGSANVDKKIPSVNIINFGQCE